MPFPCLGRHALTLATCAVFLALPAHAQLFGSRSAPAPVVLNQGDALPPLADLVASSGAQVPPPKRIVVGAFSVEFSTEHALSVAQGGLGGTVRQSTEVALQGVDAQGFQAITDAAYAAFLARAREAGFEVVSKEELLASPAYQAALAAGKPSGTVKESAGLKLTSFAPQGMVLGGIGLAPGATDYAAAGGGTLGALSALASGISNTKDAIESGTKLQAAATALGNAQLVQVRLALYFAEIKGEFGNMTNHLKAGTNARMGLYVDPRNTQMVLMPAEGGAGRNFNIKQALLVDGKPFTGTEDVSPTGRNVGIAIFRAVVGAGGGDKANRYNVKADPAVYSELAGVALQRTGHLLLDALKATP